MLIDFHTPAGELDARLVALVDRHGLDGCRIYLEELRWPHGVECPRCSCPDVNWLERRRRYACRSCRYQFRVTARTVFHDSHLPLGKWFVAISLMLASPAGVSAGRLHQVLGGSYKSSWFLEHRIRSALAPGAAPDGLVAYVDDPPLVEPGAAPADGPTGTAEAVPGWLFLRGVIAGDHRSVGPRYLTAYWNEARWRDANRRNPNAFRDTVRALLAHPWLPYGKLTGRSGSWTYA